MAALAAAECLTSHHSGSQKSSGTLGEGGANTLESDPPATPAQAATSCSETPAAFTPPVNEQALDQAREHLAKFVGADNLRGAWVVGFTIVQWVGLLLGGVWWFHQPAALATWWGLGVSAFWLFLRVGTYVRPFITMHDAMHGTFFTKRWLNNLAGHMLGALVFIDATGVCTVLVDSLYMCFFRHVCGVAAGGLCSRCTTGRNAQRPPPPVSLPVASSRRLPAHTPPAPRHDWY